MLQYYLRAEGLVLSWVGTGRLIFSLNYSDADFAAVHGPVPRGGKSDGPGRLVVERPGEQQQVDQATGAARNAGQPLVTTRRPPCGLILARTPRC